MIKKTLLLTFCLSLSLSAGTNQSSIEVKPETKSIIIDKQIDDVVDLVSETIEHKMVEESYQDTCTKQVPYTENVCRNVTEYDEVNCRNTEAREECKNVPRKSCTTSYEEVCENKTERVCTNNPREVCENRTFPVCHNETTTKEECRNVTEQVCSSRPRQVCENQSFPVCRNETKYKEECRNVTEQVCNSRPREVCETRTVPICQTVTKHKEECKMVRGEPVCEEKNGRRICRPGEPQRVCEQVAYQDKECHNESKQVCETRNEQSCRDVTKRECSQVPYQEQVCHNESRQVCETRNEQSCRDVTKRECSQVPHQEEVCHDESRRICETRNEESCRNVTKRECSNVPRENCRTVYERQCHTIPSERICDKVPRTRKVCENVTKHKTEQYACTKTRQVPKSELIKKDHAKVLFDIKRVGEIGQLVTVNATLSGADLSFTAESDEILVFIDQKEGESSEEKKIELTLMNRALIELPFIKGISSLKYKKGVISFVMGKIADPAIVGITVEIKHHKKVLFERELGLHEIAITPIDEELSKVSFNLKDLRGKGLLLHHLFKYDVKIVLTPKLPKRVISKEHQIERRVFKGDL